MAQTEFRYSYVIPTEKVTYSVKLDEDEQNKLRAAADLLESLYHNFSDSGFKSYDSDRNNIIMTGRMQNLHIYAEELYDVMNMCRISNE